jgi:Ca2+-binding EF-hand superfamily protein
MELVSTVFDFFDTDGEGSIEGSELKDQLTHPNVADEVFDEILILAVGKKDCTFEEFTKLIENL